MVTQSTKILIRSRMQVKLHLLSEDCKGGGVKAQITSS